MTMVSTGPISIGGSATSGGLNQSINIELGRAAGATSSLNEAALRTLAGVPSGAISLSNFYGKSNAFAATISTNQTNLNLRTWALANGWNGSSTATITVNAGVWIYATTTANAGLTTGSFPGGLTIINNGNIIGMGGIGGGSAGASNTYQAAQNGGPAISLGVNTSITNNGYIAGGGGGGGGGQSLAGGGGAGGGAGGYAYVNNGVGPVQNRPGGVGGSIGASGGNSSSGETGDGSSAFSVAGGGGGGRILPGVGGVSQNASFIPSAQGGIGGGAGGSGAGSYGISKGGQGNARGGNGGSAGNAGSSSVAGAGGGGWGASGGTNTTSSLNGGAGGRAITLNGYTATRTGSGTTYGAVS